MHFFSICSNGKMWKWYYLRSFACFCSVLQFPIEFHTAFCYKKGMQTYTLLFLHGLIPGRPRRS